MSVPVLNLNVTDLVWYLLIDGIDLSKRSGVLGVGDRRRWGSFRHEGRLLVGLC